MAYYSKIMSLKNITDHIYGRDNMITRTDRPNLFIKELNIYMDYLKQKLEAFKVSINKKDEKYLLTFISNLNEGILYYKSLFYNMKTTFEHKKDAVFIELFKCQNTLNAMTFEIQNMAVMV
jgi:hypothetical protein